MSCPASLLIVHHDQKEVGEGCGAKKTAVSVRPIPMSKYSKPRQNLSKSEHSKENIKRKEEGFFSDLTTAWRRMRDVKLISCADFFFFFASRWHFRILF